MNDEHRQKKSQQPITVDIEDEPKTPLAKRHMSMITQKDKINTPSRMF